MCKKITAILLIIIILFNVFAYEKVKAEPVTLGVSFLVFAALLTTFGVTVSSINDMQSLYGKFQSDLGISFATFKATASMLYQSMLSLGKNFTIDFEDTNLAKFVSWVKSNFSEGYNTYIIQNSLVSNEVKDLSVGENISIRLYPNDIVEGRTVNLLSHNGLVSFKITRVLGLYYYDYDIFGKKGSSDFAISYTSYIDVSLSRSANNLTGRYRIVRSSGSGDISIFNSIPFPTSGYEVPSFNDGVISKFDYIGADVLTNPTREPENVPFPPPPLTLPGLEDTTDGRIYSGTPGQLVQDLENNPAVIEDMVKKYLSHNPATVGSIGTFPTVNENDGTITFPNTTVGDIPWDIPIDSPWDIPIDVPVDVPVPADVPQGLGVIGWLLKYIAQGITGIWNFLVGLFSAPTKKINFDGLMNLDVKGKFPFCLPWDLSNVLTALVAPAQVPQFHFNFLKTNILIDFTQFEKIAAITRWGSTLTYTLSLIMISRKLIGGE